MHKFRTGLLQNAPIMKVEVIRETEKCVYIKGYRGAESRESKRAEYRNYFGTWAEAHQFLMGRAQAHLKSAQQEYKSSEARLNEIKNLKPEDAQCTG